MKPAAEPIGDLATRTTVSFGQRLRRLVTSGIRGRVGTILGLVLFGLAALALWEGAFRIGLVSRFVLPSAIDTMDEVWEITWSTFTGGVFLSATLLTLQEIMIGFALASATGIALGIVLGETSFGRRILMPYVVAFNSMPKVAFAPLFVAWLGFGTAPKILLAAVVAFFPVVINTAVGIESYSVNSLLLFKAIEATRWKTLWKLKFPTALPYVFAGLKTAAVLSVIGAVVGEFLSGGTGGLGRRISIASLNLRTDHVFGLIVVLSILGLLVYWLVVAIERRVVHWRESEKTQA